MKFSAPRLLLLEDFPEEHREWLEQLTIPLNTVLEQVGRNLDGGLTVEDNFNSVVTELDVVASQVYPMLVNVESLRKRPVSVEIASFRALDGTIPTAGCTNHWYDDDGGLKITLFGLDAAKKYKVKLIIKG